MKSLLITTGIFAPDIGGPASYARTLGKRFTQQGVAVTILAYSSVMQHGGDRGLPFRVRRVWTGLPWGVRHAWYAFQTFRFARGSEAILALNAVSAGVPAAMAARLTHTPLVVRIVGDYAWEIALQTGRTFLLIDDFQKSPTGGRIGRLRRLQTWTCRQAKAIIVPSQYLAGVVMGWGVPQEKLRVVYNGVELPVVQASKEEARKHIGISGNLIVSCGRLVPWKGFRMLIKLLPQLLQVNQFFRLAIVGDGPDQKMLQTVIRTLGLERKVFLVGRKSASELAWYLAAADLFVLNTGYEGFSHQILEAMQAGIPVITTTAGGNREVIVQGQNGIMVRYNDEFNLLEAIKAVWKQGDLREKLVANARHTVAAFSTERMYEATKEVLTEVTSDTAE
ncbi:MAG TPA: glycosyltransferase family 4 protein [Candidatus Paceibacterota bacterium]|nr:glycosyltransferase family 4 protein [Candidatus Paceibacterota bacterium]